MRRTVAEEPNLKVGEKFKYFMAAHWRGVIVVITPLLLLSVLRPFPPLKFQWAAFTLLLMAIYWVTECIPLAVTSFFPVVIFPLSDVANTRDTCRCYTNDTIIMFMGSLILASSVEASGLHKRMAYFFVRLIGYSHLKLLLAVCCVTTFASMWITNTAATTMMVPINFAILKVFEDQKVLNMYDTTHDGDLIASDTTACYFCSVTFSATIGGIGTLVGTATNLVLKGLFAAAYPDAPEYLSFPMFSTFTIPLMIVLEIMLYFNMIIVYFGFLRPGSAVAKASAMPVAAKEAAKAAIAADVKKMGGMTMWEAMVCILFGGAMLAFFSRSPQLFQGWGDKLVLYHKLKDQKFIRDSALAMFVSYLMFNLPRELKFTKSCTATYKDQLPKTRTCSVLDWAVLNSQMPFSFSFLLGGGFALSTAAKTSGLNDKLGLYMQALGGLPNPLIVFIVGVVVILVTNFASNVAVCNVFTPIAMQLAKEVKQNPLCYALSSGVAASFCFLLPVGTPGNLIAQSAAKIPTGKMIYAGLGPTASSMVMLWLATMLWAPILWPDLLIMPHWVSTGGR